MKRIAPLKAPSPHYRQIWRLVDGALRDCLESHPDYLTPAGKRGARLSIIKRVTGALSGYVEQSTRGRSGENSAATIGRGLRQGQRPGFRSRRKPKSVLMSVEQTEGGAILPASLSPISGERAGK